VTVKRRAGSRESDVASQAAPDGAGLLPRVVGEQAVSGLARDSPQLLERTFSLLSLFAPDRPEWTTTELSSVSGLPVPTAHRIVVALQRHNFLVRDPVTKCFRLGPAAIALGRAALSATDLPTVAAKLLPRLTADTEETSLLTVLSDGGDSAICLSRVESPHPLRLSVQPGRTLPLHAGASQKALLAFLPAVGRERIVSGPLEKFCARTLDTRAALLAEIDAIRSRGWAHSFEETNAGVWGVAVALLDASGHAVAAVGIAGPQVRASREGVQRCLRATVDAAGQMAAALGLRPSAGDHLRVASQDLPRALRG
jgi:IclR family transcriptional regulator, acetate operon repressor